MMAKNIPEIHESILTNLHIAIDKLDCDSNELEDIDDREIEDRIKRALYEFQLLILRLSQKDENENINRESRRGE